MSSGQKVTERPHRKCRCSWQVAAHQGVHGQMKLARELIACRLGAGRAPRAIVRVGRKGALVRRVFILSVSRWFAMATAAKHLPIEGNNANSECTPPRRHG